MRGTRSWRCRAVLLAPVLLLLTAAPARAAEMAFVIVWGNGETITHLQDLSPEARQLLPPEMPRGLRVGFIYNYVHVFWCNLWTWNGRYVLYGNNRYWPLEAGELEMLTGKTESDFGKPFFYHFPLGLMILCGLFVLSGVVSLVNKRKGNRAGPAGATLDGLIPEQPQQPIHFCYTQLYQPDEVLRQRVHALEDFMQFAKAIDAELTAFAAGRQEAGQALSLFAAVRRGHRGRFWLDFQPGVPSEAEQDLLRRLEVIPVPAVNGPVALANYSLLWGGPGTRENLFAYMPLAWAEAVVAGGTVPDDALDKVWPEGAA
jgi:hypothetical protein